MLVLKRKVNEKIRILCNGEEIEIVVVDANYAGTRLGILANPEHVYIMRDNSGCVSCNIHVGDRGSLVQIDNKHCIICEWCKQKLENNVAIRTPFGIINRMPTTICEYGNGLNSNAPQVRENGD
jgi:sRNA-binding carbon storage regulator CsrA